MTRRPVLGGILGTAALALTLLPAAPRPRGGDGGDEVGDLPTNTRGASVAESGEGVAMSHVANLQYTPSGTAQNGSDVEFLKIGRSEYALAGTLREGLQIIDITDPEESLGGRGLRLRHQQGDIQVWRHGDRVLASYTADGTFGEAGAASRCGRDLEPTPPRRAR